MNFSLYISKRLRYTDKNSFTRIVTRISIATIVIGVAVMIVTLAILNGYKKAIREKITSLGGHLIVTKYNTNAGYEDEALSFTSEATKRLMEREEVDYLQPFAFKPNLIKHGDIIQGTIIKGINKDYNQAQFASNMIDGEWLSFTDSSYDKGLILSQTIARLINGQVGDTIICCFLQDPPRFRRMHIKGIYSTGLEEFDENLVLGDLRLIQNLNQWPDTLAGGLEVYLKKFSLIDDQAYTLFTEIPPDWGMEKITQKYIQIFEWLQMLNSTAAIPITIVLIVAIFNMLSTLLIMILERTNMIGSLKAMGATNGQVAGIFVYKGLQIILYGMLLGNALGLGLVAIQYFFKAFPLDPANYYISYVPVDWVWLDFLQINVLAFACSFLVFLLPVIVISNMKPIKSIKFQ